MNSILIIIFFTNRNVFQAPHAIVYFVAVVLKLVSKTRSDMSIQSRAYVKMTYRVNSIVYQICRD